MTSYARLLGVPQYPVSETWHDLPITKASGLLLYLAYRGTWVSRDELLYLFYPDTPETPARANLRQLLTSLRRLPYSEGLETEDLRLRWQIETDVAHFKKAVSEEKWAKALELYQGEFLHGFQLRESEFDNWLASERQALHDSWRKAGLNFAKELSGGERYPLAAEVLAPLYKADPLDEEMLRAYLETLYHSNQKSEALETFATFIETLHHELGSEPEASTLELISNIQQDKPLTAKGSVMVTTQPREAKPRHNLPLQPTLFVGREKEKAKLAELLADPVCRLVTIVAPGGMGKTRVAIEIARAQLENFERVCFVSFAATTSPDLMVYTLADALELSLFGVKPPKEQVLDYLKNKKMLLVLDNLEQLLSGVDLISDLLATAPEVKILSTSRERLQLQAEHMFDLAGLTVPDSLSMDIGRFDALQLFAQRTKHNRLDFELVDNLSSVTKICQLVGGMPLAIELAASWSRLLNPSEIMQELEQSLDILSTSTKDLPERHHSMRTVFEASWQRLTDEEQAALRKLSVFQGGFEKEAARAIAQLDLSILLPLINKSFLWRNSLGRFSQHPLILQYLRQQANDYPEEKKQTEEKHGLYYLELLKKQAPQLRMQRAKESREVLEKELPNIRAAWDWALHEKRVEEIKNYAQALSGFLDSYHNQEGADIFKQAIAALDETNPEHHTALGYAFIQQAWHEHRLDTNSKSVIELTERGLAILKPLEELPGILRGQITLGEVVRQQGELVKAKEIFTSALSLARTYSSPLEIGQGLNTLFAIERNLGGLSEVSALMRDSLKELRELGNLVNLKIGLTLFGSYLVDNYKLEEGEKLLRESLELAQKSNYYVVPNLAELARLAYKRCDFSGAETLVQEAYDKASKAVDMFMQATTSAILGRVKLAQGHLAEAEQFLVESLRLGWLGHKPFAVSHSLVFLAELKIVKKQIKQGVSLLSFLSHYQVIEKRDRDEAVKLLEKAKEQLSSRDFTEAQEASKILTLEQVVTGILERSYD